MARIDDYITAKGIAVEKLAVESFEELLKRSGLDIQGGNRFRVPFLDRIFIVTFPDFDFIDEADSTQDVPIQEQILILHYIMACITTSISGTWVAYREIPGASFYTDVFMKRAAIPLKKRFGNDISAFETAAQRLGGRKINEGDAAFEFMVFPKVPIRLILWMGDDEFPPEATILFDKTIGDILSPEDVAWLSGMLVYRLMRLA